jgi:hypothetical protein
MAHLSKNKLIAAVAMLGLTFTATAAAAQAHEPSNSTTTHNDIAAVTDCDGRQQKASFVRTNDADVEIGETTFFTQVPNTLRTFPISDAEDQVRITFMAEAALFGAPFDNSGVVDALGIEIRLDGSPLPPATSDLGFTTTVHHANATMACRRVGPGTHTVEVFWRVIDKGTDNILTGRLDDWSLDIQIND